MRWMTTFLLLLWACISLGIEISQKELEEDRELLKEINRRLDILDKRVNGGEASVEVIDELNSFGYPLYVLKQKYLDYNEPRYGKYHDTYFWILDTQERLFFVKRGLLPALIGREVKRQKLPVCGVELKGKDRRTLLIRMKNPESDAEIERVIENTQIKYVQMIGIRTVNFDRCK